MSASRLAEVASDSYLAANMGEKTNVYKFFFLKGLHTKWPLVKFEAVYIILGLLRHFG